MTTFAPPFDQRMQADMAALFKRVAVLEQQMVQPMGSAAGVLPTTAPTLTAGQLGLYSNSGVLTLKDFAGTTSKVTPAQADASLNNLLGWAFDPMMGVASQQLNSGSSGSSTRINLASVTPVTNIVINISIGGSGLTSNQNWAALYNSSGTLVGSSANQSSAWTGTGNIVMALTGGPFTVEPGSCYVAFICNGTTAPKLLGMPNNTNAAAYNAGITAAPYRSGSVPSIGSTPPGSITLGSMNPSAPVYWAGLS